MSYVPPHPQAEHHPNRNRKADFTSNSSPMPHYSLRRYSPPYGRCSVRSCEVGSLPAELKVPLGAWVVCEAPCRVDLAGGWSDTPPICYEAHC